ncbi:MAG TPA: hypothetical protein DCS07_17640 [Bdellovibrionales bacterium]|nr:MAG: hypothetical protein A2X97_08500 [Bdellovibrionales bacterium GWA1_52_35]OFZ34920.1 MAG: hypothetical protein A2070_11895 [Bdellovibrionales bacterium GWC1_52_8]HAR44425.1 hypothetical protein [Bdellovibrionales bacterium]HCM39775.1 hypothetical protein [Bdellovibrionales bacterium]
MRKLIELLKANFFAGILVLIPIGVIIWIAGWALGILWGLRELLPEDWSPESFSHDPSLISVINFALILAALLVLAISISGLGWASKHYLGKKVLEGIAQFIERIPFLRSIYSALDQLLKTMAAQGSQQFNRVVYIEYPRSGTWALAFVTGTARPPWGTPDTEYLNIYVPTTPNPTSGFHLIVAEKDTREAHLKVEEAFKVILSLGLAHSGKVPHGGRTP